MFRSSDLPADKTLWPHIFRATIGSPDPNGRQLDGMGGGLSSLSKVCVVGPSSREDADVDYTFAAIGVKDDDVDFSSNCGNMTSAIGPFAVDAGIIEKPIDGDCSVTICNTNSNKLIRAVFPVRDGEATMEGDFAIDGVAGTAAKIALDFLDPAGSKTGKLLPTGNIKDTLDGVEATCIDVGNPCVFVHASHLKVPGSIAVDDIETHPTLLGQLDSIRRKAGVAMGVASTEAKVPGSIPKIGMVSTPHAHRILSGAEVTQDWCDVMVRALSVGQPHRAVPITVALALAVASRLPGTTVNECTSTSRVDADGVTIGHTSGRLLVGADFGPDGGVRSATVFRTARRLMEGRIFWKS